MTCNSFGFFAIMKGKTMNMLKLSTFFQNGMVLQQDKEIKIWGEGKAGAQVRIPVSYTHLDVYKRQFLE